MRKARRVSWIGVVIQELPVSFFCRQRFFALTGLFIIKEMVADEKIGATANIRKRQVNQAPSRTRGQRPEKSMRIALGGGRR
jgi:hypothetical protein